MPSHKRPSPPPPRHPSTLKQKHALPTISIHPSTPPNPTCGPGYTHPTQHVVQDTPTPLNRRPWIHPLHPTCGPGYTHPTQHAAQDTPKDPPHPTCGPGYTHPTQHVVEDTPTPPNMRSRTHPHHPTCGPGHTHTTQHAVQDTHTPPNMRSRTHPPHPTCGPGYPTPPNMRSRIAQTRPFAEVCPLLLPPLASPAHTCQRRPAALLGPQNTAMLPRHADPHPSPLQVKAQAE